MKIFAIILVLFVLAGAPSAGCKAQPKGKATKAAAPAKPDLGNVDGVTAQQLRDYLTFIASDEMEGARSRHADSTSRRCILPAIFRVGELSLPATTGHFSKGSLETKQDRRSKHEV